MRKRSALLLAAALLLSGCEEASGKFVDYFKEEHHVDLSDPSDVGTKKQFGNPDEKAALGTYQGLRRVVHEGSGEAAYGRKDWAAAREQFSKAREWTTTDDPTDAGRASSYSTLSRLNGRYADAWLRQADEEAKASADATSKSHFLQAVSTYKNAIDGAEEAAKDARKAGLDPQPYEMQRAKYLGRAARAYYGAGNESSACAYAMQALQIDPSHKLALGVKNKLNCQ